MPYWKGTRPFHRIIIVSVPPAVNPGAFIETTADELSTLALVQGTNELLSDSLPITSVIAGFLTTEQADKARGVLGPMFGDAPMGEAGGRKGGEGGAAGAASACSR